MVVSRKLMASVVTGDMAANEFLRDRPWSGSFHRQSSPEADTITPFTLSSNLLQPPSRTVVTYILTKNKETLFLLLKQD